MSTDWWPAPLAHIAAEEPWAHDDVIVAEVKSFDEHPSAGCRQTFTALVPSDQIDGIQNALASFDHDVTASGPHPCYEVDRPFKPAFWVGATNLPNKQYEPLVLSWVSHDTTVLQPDLGFLMTYGLVPRAGNGGTVYWDEPKVPRKSIVTVSSPSVWRYPLGTHAYVSIARDFLQDYLTLRHVALVQTYWEIRWGTVDPEIEVRLGDKDTIDVAFADRRLQLGRHGIDRDTIFAQVWGARIIALPGGIPISSNALDNEGLRWPGIDAPVTRQIARSLKLTDWVYVDDAVLAYFEERPEFRIHPESGSVSHGTQWSVNYCTRLGRNLIRLEPKKLYEGAPPEIIRHWNKFAVPPPSRSAYPAILDEPNIATRAKDITFAVALLGEALANMARSVGLADVTPKDFAGLDRSLLEYQGWWTFEGTQAVSRHVPLALSADAFLDRCMSLNKMITEGLSEGHLRRVLGAIGVPTDATKDLRTLKLLDLIVRLAQLSLSTGLVISKDGTQLWERLIEGNTAPEQPIAHLFALYDVRLVKAHKVGHPQKRLQDLLGRFGIVAGEEASGYGKILDRVYDLLIAELQETNDVITAAV